MPEDHQDKELDPKRLRFGMSKAEIEEAKRRVREKKKKLAKGWKPEGH